MKVLIVFEQADEPTIKTLVEMNEKDYEFFKDANNYIINNSGYDAQKSRAVDTIYSALSNETPDEDELSQLSEHENKWRGKFCDSVIDSVSDIEDVDKFITCGWY